MSTSKSFVPVHGILLLDKPQGLTSNVALQKVKRLFSAQKAGHTGSLDPLATGMLPICFGEATKISQYMLDADKCYETTALLGIKTSTADSTGTVLSQTNGCSISQAQLSEVLERFRGKITQVPSMFSALKHQGLPLYYYARKGIALERKSREVVIRQLQLDALNKGFFSLTVRCSKGTYIRNLVEDIGDALGVGAHVTALRRRYTSGFEMEPMFQLNELEELSMEEKMTCLIPMDRAVAHFARVDLSLGELHTIRLGQKLLGKLPSGTPQTVRLYDPESQFVGLGQQELDGDLKAKRLLSFTSLGRMPAFD